MKVKGIEITCELLRIYEDRGMSEAEISSKFGISRLTLYRTRIKMGCRVRFRSDRGTRRVSDEEKRIRWNAYMRKYYREHYSKSCCARMRIGKKVVSRSRHNAVIVLGRSLSGVEVVHHIDSNPMNDSYENLMVFANQGDHLAWHRGENVKPIEAEII